MTPIFLPLFIKLIPLYVIMGLGFVAGRWLQVEQGSVARLMIYIIIPAVFFGAVTKMTITPGLLLVPVVTYCFALAIGLPVYAFSKWFYKDNRANIMALAAGTGNFGYFGLPIALLLFDAQTVGIYLLGVMGVSLFENSVGFYLTAKGQHTPRDALYKVLRLPALYALLLGATLSLMRVTLPEVVYTGIEYFKGAYTVLGMMMIGLGLAGMQRFRLEWSFVGILFFAKMFMWPAVTLLFLSLDAFWLGWYGDEVHRALLLMSFMPLAANTVAIASLLNAYPERMAAAVLISTLLGALYVPWMVTLMLH